jgi:hypothetical protein
MDVTPQLDVLMQKFPVTTIMNVQMTLATLYMDVYILRFPAMMETLALMIVALPLMVVSIQQLIVIVETNVFNILVMKHWVVKLNL